MEMLRDRPWALGLPLWGQADWKGGLYPQNARSRAFLEHYARVMDAVEGNTTFYSLPPASAVDRWRACTPEHFRFSFKFPRTITHDRALRHADRDTAEFLGRIAPLGARIGPFMIQLPARFGPEALPDLGRFLRRLPHDYRYGVEVRHRGFFSRGDGERLDGLLQAHDVERIVMDTRGMRIGDPEHPGVVAAAHEKPDVPVVVRALTHTPVVRFVAHPVAATNAPYLAHWAATIADWLRAGRRPTFFMHCPDNAHSPALARRLDRLVRARVPMPALPDPTHADAEEGAAQLSLI